MAPRKDSSSGSDSDSDVPEAIPLTRAKKQIQKLESSRQKAVLAERQSKKTQNRERDKKLKERAEKNRDFVKGKTEAKGKGNEREEDDDDDHEEDEAVDGLEARMLRAMKDAQEEDEDEEDDDFEGFEGVQQLNDEQDDEDNESDSDQGSEDSDEEDDDEGENDSESQGSEESDQEALLQPSSKPKTSTKFNPDHLPDELFEAAFTSQTSAKRTFTDDLDISSKNKTTARPTKKRKANPNTPKDVVVGSRAIRVLPSSTQPPTPSTLPSRKIKHFLDRTLALKGGKQRTKGWERKPTNIGVLRRDAGPAANFVRNR